MSIERSGEEAIQKAIDALELMLTDVMSSEHEQSDTCWKIYDPVYKCNCTWPQLRAEVQEAIDGLKRVLTTESKPLTTGE